MYYGVQVQIIRVSLNEPHTRELMLKSLYKYMYNVHVSVVHNTTYIVAMHTYMFYLAVYMYEILHVLH